MGMIRYDCSEGKWRKTGQDRVDKSDQCGQYRGGEIRVDQINKIRLDQEKQSESGREEQSEWIRYYKAVAQRVYIERGEINQVRVDIYIYIYSIDRQREGGME